MCRICGQYQETIDHIVAGCPELTKTEYLHRHDKAVSYLHWNICKELNINIEMKWYEHEPQTVTKRYNITILWDMPIQTDRQIKANRPGIVIKDKQEKSCLLIDMSIPNEKNTSVKVFFFFFIKHLQFILGNCYRLQKKEINKKKRKDKVHQNTTVYILTIERRLSALWSYITHRPVFCLYFN